MFEIAKMCLDEDNIFSALENFHRAKEMFEELGDKKTAMLAYDFFAYVMHKVMEYSHAWMLLGIFGGLEEIIRQLKTLECVMYFIVVA